MVKTVITREQPEEEGGEVQEDRESEEYQKIFLGEVPPPPLFSAYTLATSLPDPNLTTQLVHGDGEAEIAVEVSIASREGWGGVGRGGGK
jgi:hypothetical protein